MHRQQLPVLLFLRLCGFSVNAALLFDIVYVIISFTVFDGLTARIAAFCRNFRKKTGVCVGRAYYLLLRGKAVER